MAAEPLTERVIDGWLNAFFEQGMEGFVEWSIYDRSFGGTATRGWNQRGNVFIEDGDLVSVFGSDEQPVWTGTIYKVETVPGHAYDRTGSLRELKLIWNDPSFWPCCTWIPRDVDGTLWTSWFYRSPHLAARLIRGTKAIDEAELSPV